MKTILYVRADGIYYDSRATKEIISLIKKGFKVVVLGWDRKGDAQEKCDVVFNEYKSKLSFCFYERAIGEVSGIKNIINVISWLLYVKKYIKANLEEFDYVHACDLDSILLSYNILVKNKKKIVYDIYDYYIDSHYYFPSLMRSFLEWCEIKIINKSDAVIICTEQRRAQIAKSRPRRIVVIHNTPEVEMLSEEIMYDYYYCGTLSDHRLLKEILDLYKENTDLKFCIAGRGALEKQAQELSAKFENFTFLGSIYYKDCLNGEAKSACLSAIYEPTIRNHKLCAPNKFYESLALGKPVIVCEGTGIDQVVKNEKIGAVIPYNANEFYKAVRYYKQHRDETVRISLSARKLYEKEFSWSIMEQRLANLYSTL